MSWTKKHDHFARACNFTQSMEHLTRWQLRRAKLNEPSEIEINLRIFNKEVAEQRIDGEYHRKTLSTAMKRLDSESNGMITIMKRYSPWVYRVLIRPLSFVERIESAKCASTPKPTTGNPMYDAEHKKRAIEQQQQNISKIDALFSKVGLKYDRSALLKIWRYSGKCLDNIVSSVELLLYRHSTQEKEIGNPNGFIIECLRDGWYKDFDLNYEPDVPRFRTKQELADYARYLRVSVKAKYGGESASESARNRNKLHRISKQKNEVWGH